jgi:hypothetical protein
MELRHSRNVNRIELGSTEMDVPTRHVQAYEAYVENFSDDSIQSLRTPIYQQHETDHSQAAFHEEQFLLQADNFSQPSPSLLAVSTDCQCGGATCEVCRRLRRTPNIWRREVPQGDMSPRLPYETESFSYYRRPYSSQDTPKQIQESLLNATSAPGQPYSNRLIGSLHRQIDTNLDPIKQDLIEDGYLEYADWREHRSRKQVAPKFQLEQQPPRSLQLDARKLPQSATPWRR